jgi:hypothetical protein
LKPFSLVLVTVICLTSGLVAVGQSKKPKPKSKANAANKSSGAKIAAKAQPNGSVETVNPGVFLLRDPLVQAELQLSAPQKAAAAELAAEFNESIWRFRDLSVDSEVAQREGRLVNAQIKPKLEGLLNAGQLTRLDGIILQVQGTDAFALSATAARLSLTSEQQTRISKILGAAREAMNDLRSRSAEGKDLALLNHQAENVQSDLRRDLLAVLTGSQRELWQELCGTPIAVSRLQPLTAQAPELRGVSAWINSEPISLKSLRGKVVVLHFWTFG